MKRYQRPHITILTTEAVVLAASIEADYLDEEITNKADILSNKNNMFIEDMEE